jgi:hypothetical protein
MALGNTKTVERSTGERKVKLGTTADQLRETLRTLAYMERLQHIRHHEEIADSESHKLYLARLKNAPVVRQDKVRVVPGSRGEAGYIAIVPRGLRADIHSNLEGEWGRYNDLAEKLRWCGFNAVNTGDTQIRVTERSDRPIAHKKVAIAAQKDSVSV